MRDHTVKCCDHTTAIKLGIELVEAHPDLMPGTMFFLCQRYQATITLETCRQNWDEAHANRGADDLDRRAACRSCTIGLQLHGKAASDSPEWADVRRSGECVRCGRVGLRQVSTTGECVSCWNRRRESERGFNARGTPLKNPVVISPHRVGLVSGGVPTYQLFSAWHDGEALSCALRQIDGAKFHSQQPGTIAWNAKADKFEYRCFKHPGEFGALREFVNIDGTIGYECPVCSPNRAKPLPIARVVNATSLSTPEIVGLLYNCAHEEWTPLPHICDRCRHYPLQIRQRGSGHVEARCPLCDQQ